jgi:trimethylamine---corrinoid protein Co-methyltransferase
MKRRRNRTRQLEQESLLADKPFRQLVNPYAPFEIISAEQLGQIHNASMTILENIGLEFLDDEAISYWQKAGAVVDSPTRRVRIDRGLVLDLVAKAPAKFTLHARNPAHNLIVGGNHINFATVGAVPYYSDLDHGRRPGTLADFKRMVKLAQICGPIHMVEGLFVEPQDIPVDQRNLEKGLAVFRYSDKVMTTAAHGHQAAADYVNMAAIVFGGVEAIQHRPVFASNVNVNSPLRYDERMLSALLVYAHCGQPCIITPFILAGAMGPITLAGAIAQQNAEALAGIALTQLVNPGVPVIYGGFTTNIEMQSGSPAFGTPEGALALLAGAQLARFYGLPYRGSGGLNTSKTPDAQAALETQWSLWPAVMAHANIILHSAGWLESGLVCSLEKFILDVEGLAMMHAFLQGLNINDESLALNSIADVGPGGHHLGTAHTMAHFRHAFYHPILADRLNYDAWQEAGGWDAAQRANQLAKQLLRDYEQPEMETPVAEELQAYVERRKSELQTKL